MELVAKVKDAEHWALLREASDKKLLGVTKCDCHHSLYPCLACILNLLLRALAVVDVHKDWCGPCKIMEPTYKRLAVDIDQSEKRVAFASVSHGCMELIGRATLALTSRMFVQWSCGGSST